MIEQFSIERNPKFCFASLPSMVGPKNASHPQPIECQTKTNHDLVACVFPRFRQFGCFHLEFSLAIKNISFLLIGRFINNLGFGFMTLNRKALYRLAPCTSTDNMFQSDPLFVQFLGKRSQSLLRVFVITWINIKSLASRW